jgi:L-ribulose-5-phosphate 3-epimerase
MTHSTAHHSPAVCSWSMQPSSPHELAGRLRQTGIGRVQLALDPLRESPAVWGDCQKQLRVHGIEIISGMFGCVGEDYSTLDSIRVTGGIAPDATWEQNQNNIRATAALAADLGLSLVTFHAGFLPREESDPAFSKMLDRLALVANIFSARKIQLGLETGQETAPALAALLGRLDHPAVGVNLDPANMILYDKGDPVEAVRVLGPWIRQVHLKDARRTRTPGTWGEEVPVGEGDVDWPGFVSALREVGFAGNFVIEREAGSQRIADICRARERFDELDL